MKQTSHQLADALAKGFRYFPENKPSLRPGITVRLRQAPEGKFALGQLEQHTLVRVDSEEDVAMLMAGVEEEKDAA